MTEKNTSLKVFILRGISGSGKSTRAKEITKERLEAVICSADDYFMVDGEYEFDAKKLHIAHKWCLGKFGQAVSNGVKTIIVDNTNTRHWEYTEYVELAKKNFYEVEIVIMPLIDAQVAFERNKHGVPLETIKNMIQRWQN